jgi:hypothetical protein
MDRFNKSFFLGIVVGAFFTITFLVGIIVLGGMWLRSAMNATQTAAVVPPPPFPIAAAVDGGWAVRSLDGRSFQLSEARGLLQSTTDTNKGEFDETASIASVLPGPRAANHPHRGTGESAELRH